METEFIALTLTSAKLQMCVMPTLHVSTLMGHSLALVNPVIMVTVSIVSILTNVLMERMIVMKTQLVSTILVHMIALAIQDTLVMERYVSIMMNAFLTPTTVMSMLNVPTLTADLLVAVILVMSATVSVALKAEESSFMNQNK